MAKSPGTAAVLGFLFGPFGLLYVGGGHCLGAFGVVILLAVMTGGVGFLLVPVLCACWGYGVANGRNQNPAPLSVPPPVPPPPERVQSYAQQQPAPVAAVVAAAPSTPALVTSTADAQHLAHSIVADVELYARDLLLAAIQSNEEPTDAIREELEEARTRFLARISPDLGTGILLFQRAVRDVIVSKYGSKLRAATVPPGGPPPPAANVTRTGDAATPEADGVHAAAQVLSPGTQLDGRYEVVSLLGRGAMAAVYKVRHLGLHSVHALKVLNSDLARNADLRNRFIAEGRIQAQMRHPNIVGVTEIVTSPVAGLVLEYVEGSTLDQYVAGKGRPLDASEIRRIMLPVLEAMDAAHAFGVIHRDLKPENIIIGHDGRGHIQPKVTDFGIAKLLDDGGVHGTKRRTQANVRMGTPLYMSPEQVRGASLVDVRSDVFSLGAILYEIATGRIAFERDSEFDTMSAIVSGTFEPPERVVAGLPTRLAACISTALQVEPKSRFQSCSAFRQALAAA